MIITDEQGNIIKLGKEIAKGGEGTVFNVQDNKKQVVKLYNEEFLESRKFSKLKIMTSLYNDNIGKFAAWPRIIVYNNNKPCGFIMEKFSDSIEIHELYGSGSRKKYFPNANWRFLVHTARNLASAVETLHRKNIIIGDINQGNILVNKQAMVKFIDCDSYQIESGNDLFLCEVGVPEYTPPELQSKSFRDTRRTFNHDNFGLAVLIFKILMMGRHPYSGDGAPSEIGEAIKKNYFCYGEAAKVNGIYTQQASFLYEILDVKLQSLFNDAFTNNMSRPSAVLWKNALSEVEATLKICSDNSMHIYSDCLNYCPWCEFEKQGVFYFGKSQVKNKKRHYRKLNNILNNKKNHTQNMPQGVINNTKPNQSLTKRPKYITKNYLRLLLQQLEQIPTPQKVIFSKLAKPRPVPWPSECKKKLWQILLVRIIHFIVIISILLLWISAIIKSINFDLMKLVIHSVILLSFLLIKPYNQSFKMEYDKRKKDLELSHQQLKDFENYWRKYSSDKKFNKYYKKAKKNYFKALKIVSKISKANKLVPLKSYNNQKREFLKTFIIYSSKEINIGKFLNFKLRLLNIKTANDLNNFNLFLLGSDGELLKKWKRLKEEGFLYKNNYNNIRLTQDNLYKKYEKNLNKYTYLFENTIYELQTISKDITFFRSTNKSQLEALRQKYLRNKLSLRFF